MPWRSCAGDLNSWRWGGPSITSICAEPVTILKAFTIRPVVTLRPSPEQRRGAVQMRIYNYRRSRPDLVVGMEAVTFQRGAPLQAVGEAIAAQSGADPKSLEWNELGNSPERIISKSFTLKNRKMPLQIGLVQLNDAQAALITFGMPTPEEGDRLLYESACREMVQSVGLLGKQGG